LKMAKDGGNTMVHTQLTEQNIVQDIQPTN
jgi:hypothetical protein